MELVHEVEPLRPAPLPAEAREEVRLKGAPPAPPSTEKEEEEKEEEEREGCTPAAVERKMERWRNKAR